METDDLGDGLRLGMRLEASADVTGLIALPSDKENDFFLKCKIILFVFTCSIIVCSTLAIMSVLLLVSNINLLTLLI